MTERPSARVDSDGERDPQNDDEFTLYDLRVEVVGEPGEMVCSHRQGDYFELSGENLSLPPGQSFPIYPLAALLPLLPAKQRRTDEADWMTTDMEVACPDPHCGARFRITRIGERTFRHSEVTAVPLSRTSAGAGIDSGEHRKNRPQEKRAFPETTEP